MPHPRRLLPWLLPSFVAIIAPAAWIASYAIPTGVFASSNDPHDAFIEFRLHRYACNYGAIAIEYAYFRNSDGPQVRQAMAKLYPRKTSIKREKWIPPRSHFLGFSVSWFPNPGRKIFSLFIPLWLFTLLGLIPLARRLARLWVARDRARASRCPACGYDMRSSPDRCPECGAIPDQVTIAPDSAPAVVAVANSSGTKCVALMAAYMSAAVFLCVLATPTRHFFLRGEWSDDYFSYLYYVLAIAILPAGAFHAAGYSRSIEGFFGCGALFSLLLAPFYVYIGRSHTVWIQLITVVIGAALLGSLLCAAATTRWRFQDRAPLRKPANEVPIAPTA
jgi:hypothetical protein